MNLISLVPTLPTSVLAVANTIVSYGEDRLTLGETRTVVDLTDPVLSTTLPQVQPSC